MRWRSRPACVAGVAAAGLAITAVLGAPGPAASAAPAPPRVMLPGSAPVATDPVTGDYTASHMTVQVALEPSHAAALARTLAGMYAPGSATYHRWLAPGQFDRQYAPSRAETAAVTSFLRGAGLSVTQSPSPFLIRATGSSAAVSGALQTTLRTYRDKKGASYYQNATPVRLPAGLAPEVQGIIGLTNTVRAQDGVVSPGQAGRAAAAPAGSATSCETPYPTTAQLFNRVNGGPPLTLGYGAAPGCTGLSPSQVNSLYGAPHAGPRGQGRGVTLGVFELSAYQHSDVDTWARQFYGPDYTPPLSDVTIDGGPLAPQCPTGDTCPAQFNNFSGDVEVDADIEMQLAVAPAAAHLVVYNAPNDFTGQTELDEWTAIANDDQVASVSSSWGLCENDAGASYVQAENTVFEQMALQGQSVFAASGDTGAFGCIRSDGTDIVNVGDPSSQPFMTSVGGTSLGNFNPGGSPHPAYPTGQETAWNVGNLCSDAAAAPDNDNLGGLFWCGREGAGGGGSSQFWGQPFYQHGPGVSSPVSTVGNDTTQCSLAAAGTRCRQAPDVSMDADEFTPYPVFCTSSASTPDSECATVPVTASAPGWIRVGGTSLSSPLWSAIIADRDSFQGHRSGLINVALYAALRTDPSRYFHDITGQGQAVADNGLFPTTAGYDEATGIGTPRMAALITGPL